MDWIYFLKQISTWAIWIYFFKQISTWVILLPLVPGLLYYRRLDADSRMILLVVIIGAIPQICSEFIPPGKMMSILYNLYTPAEFTIYWMIFNKRITSQNTERIKKITLYLFIAISLFVVFFLGLQKRFVSQWVIANNLIQITWVCLCLLEYYRNDNIQIEVRQPFFWFLAGITTYASCTVVFYGLWSLIKSPDHLELSPLKIVHYFFNTLIYCIFSIGLLKNKHHFKAGK